MKVTTYPYVNDSVLNNVNVRLCWYHKHGDILIGEETLHNLTLHDLQDIFDVYINNKMINCWHVKTRHARVLQKLTEHRISTKKYTYFVEQHGFC